jgi:hypothetical protein
MSLAAHEVRAARTGGWLFIGSLAAFAAGVATIVVGADPDYAAAEQAAADRLDVPVGSLPAAAVAQLAVDHPANGSAVVAVLLPLAMLLFSLGTLAAVGAASRGRGWLRGLAVAFGLLAPLGWFGYMLLESRITSGAVPPAVTLEEYDTYARPAMSASGLGACLALICLVVLLRPLGIARRTGLVVVVACGLAALAAVAVGVPPILPLLLAGVLGVVLVRTRPSVAAPAEEPMTAATPAVR